MTGLSSVRYLVTAGVWAICAAAAVFWGLRLFVSASPVPAQALAVATDQALRGDPSRLFGSVAASAGPAAAPALASRFRLIGVVAAAASDSAFGLALIAIDGKPPRAYHVGASLEDNLVLQSVQRRAVQIGPAGGASVLALELPALPMPATGTLPSGGTDAAVSVPATRVSAMPPSSTAPLPDPGAMVR
ncbi:MAG: type II secretion system protein N [Leptothrix sp. (in: b-proteobacteria)]